MIEDIWYIVVFRYRRAFSAEPKYNAFVVISDGVNNKYGSFFSPYNFFYAWRKIESEDTELDGINSLITMVKGTIWEYLKQKVLLKIIKTKGSGKKSLFPEKSLSAGS